MKYPLSRLLLLTLTLRVLNAASTAADAPAPAHWYQFYIREGASSQSFTGTSSLTSSEISAEIVSEHVIRLEKLRSFGVVPGSGDVTLRWHTSPEENGATLFIVPRNIIYFYEYAADPLSQNAPSPGQTEPARASK